MSNTTSSTLAGRPVRDVKIESVLITASERFKFVCYEPFYIGTICLMVFREDVPTRPLVRFLRFAFWVRGLKVALRKICFVWLTEF